MNLYENDENDHDLLIKKVDYVQKGIGFNSKLERPLGDGKYISFLWWDFPQVPSSGESVSDSETKSVEKFGLIFEQANGASNNQTRAHCVATHLNTMVRSVIVKM